jgi:hypothetical protein
MCLGAEVSKGRFACYPTIVKQATTRIRPVPITCAAPAAIRMFETLLYEFGFLATYLKIALSM